jgi:hypothetical protein
LTGAGCCAVPIPTENITNIATKKILFLIRTVPFVKC